MSIFSVNSFPPWLHRLLSIGLLWLVTGCAGIPTQERPDKDAPRQTPASSRAYQNAIHIAGRLSIRYEQNGREESLHGSFDWNQQPQGLLLTLLSPLAQTVATIENTASMATLRQAGQPPRMATDVDALTAETLGWPLPVAGLRYWLQGFATRSDGSQFIAMPGTEARTSVTTLDGWNLNYASWNQEATPPHPRRIDLQRDTAQAGKVEIRLIIDTWQAVQQ